jgi:YfiH family protein
MSGEEKYLTVPALERIPDLVHGFGTRTLGLPALRRLAARNGCRVVQLSQVHSAEIIVVGGGGPGLSPGVEFRRTRPRIISADVYAQIPRRGSVRREGDALVTGRAGLILAVRTADCLPVLLVDPDRRVVAAVHAGWRGTRSRILERAVDALVSRFDCRARSLLAAFGPCIAAGCYEVGPDVRRDFAAAGLSLSVFRPSPRHPDAFLLDLAAANRRQLLGRGLSARNIFPSSSCTHCDGRLLSFRRDRDADARLYNFIGFRPADI